MDIGFRQIRVATINALTSDDELFDRLVLKGGNALHLVHECGDRTSIDLDFSLELDFPDIDEAKRDFERALNKHFSLYGWTAFDVALLQKPKAPKNPMWRGYQLVFKVIETSKYQELKDDHVKLQREANVIAAGQQRKFTVDLSCHEFTDGKIEMELNDYPVQVYSLPMIGIEKFRAICQQLPEYPLRPRKSARARDFYDIYNISTSCELLTETVRELGLGIFQAKEVPVALLGKLSTSKEFHRPDWQSVLNSVGRELEFDFYFEHAVDLGRRLESFWNE